MKTDIETRCNDCNTSYTLLRPTRLPMAEHLHAPGRLCCKADWTQQLPKHLPG